METPLISHTWPCAHTYIHTVTGCLVLCQPSLSSPVEWKVHHHRDRINGPLAWEVSWRDERRDCEWRVREGLDWQKRYWGRNGARETKGECLKERKGMGGKWETFKEVIHWLFICSVKEEVHYHGEFCFPKWICFVFGSFSHDYLFKNKNAQTLLPVCFLSHKMHSHVTFTKTPLDQITKLLLKELDLFIFTFCLLKLSLVL